jgi:hypothetical protein
VTERGGGGVKRMGREKKPTILGRKKENMMRGCDKERV